MPSPLVNRLLEDEGDTWVKLDTKLAGNWARGLKVELLGVTRRGPITRVKCRVALDQPYAGQLFTIGSEALTHTNPHAIKTDPSTH
jgi:hypothetical protein